MTPQAKRYYQKVREALCIAMSDLGPNECLDLLEELEVEVDGYHDVKRQESEKLDLEPDSSDED